MKLPEHPEKLSIVLTMNGGMQLYTKEIYISYDSCKYTVNRYGTIQQVNYQLSKDEINELYQYLINQQIGKIKSNYKPVYDRGGYTISIIADGKQVFVDNSGAKFIKKKYLVNFDNIVDTLIYINKKATEQFKINVYFDIDSATDIHRFSVNIDEYFYRKEETKLPARVRMFKKNNILEVAYNKNKYQKIILHELYDNQKIMLNVEADSIVVETIVE